MTERQPQWLKDLLKRLREGQREVEKISDKTTAQRPLDSFFGRQPEIVPEREPPREPFDLDTLFGRPDRNRLVPSRQDFTSIPDTRTIFGGESVPSISENVTIPFAQEEGQFEERRDKLWEQVIGSPLGGQFFAKVGIDPLRESASLTEEEVVRLEKEVGNVETQAPETFIPFYEKEWRRGWRVPRAWEDVAIAFEPRLSAEAGFKGLYEINKGITLTRGGISPFTIAHEMAHQQWVGLNPNEQREAGDLLDRLVKSSKEFRDALGRIGGEEWANRPVERHAVLYALSHGDPTKIPGNLRGFYSDLLSEFKEFNLDFPFGGQEPISPVSERITAPFTPELGGLVTRQIEEETPFPDIPPEGLDITPGFPLDPSERNQLTLLPSGQVMQRGVSFPLGSIDPETGEFSKSPQAHGISALEKPLQVLEGALAPIRAGAIGLREIIKGRGATTGALADELKQLNYEYLQGGLSKEEYLQQREDITGRMGKIGREFENLPLPAQLAWELPGWVITSLTGISGLKGISALKTAAKAGTIPKTVATVGRVGLEATGIPTIERGAGFVLQQTVGRVATLPPKIARRLAQAKLTKIQKARFDSISAEAQEVTLTELGNVLQSNPRFAERATPELVSRIASGMDKILQTAPKMATASQARYGIIGLNPQSIVGSPFARSSARAYAQFVLEWGSPQKSPLIVEALKKVGHTSEAIRRMNVDVAWDNLVRASTFEGALGVLDEISPIISGVTTPQLPTQFVAPEAVPTGVPEVTLPRGVGTNLAKASQIRKDVAFIDSASLKEVKDRFNASSKEVAYNIALAPPTATTLKKGETWRSKALRIADIMEQTAERLRQEAIAEAQTQPTPPAEVPEVTRVPRRGIVPATRPFEIRLTQEELVTVEGSAFHATGGEGILGILDKGVIETGISRGDVLGEDVVSLSKFKAAADDIFTIEVKDTGFRDRGGAIQGDVVEGLEVVSDKSIPIADIKSVTINIGSDESLETKELVTGQILASIKKQLEDKGIKVIVEQVEPTPPEGVPPIAEVPPELPSEGVDVPPPPVKPPPPPDVSAEIPPANPPSGRPRTLLDLNREAKGMRAMTPEQRAESADIARPITENELLYKVKPFKEHADNLLGPDSPLKQALRETPGLKQIAEIITPAQMERKNPIAMIGIRKAIFEEIETGRARIATLAWWNDAEDLLGFKKVKGLWKATKVKPSAKADTKKPYYATIHDIVEHPSHYILTEEQSRILKVASDMQTQILRDAQRVGVNAIEMTGEYWRRIVTKGPKDQAFTSKVSGRISGKKGYTMQRAFEFVDDGVKAGFQYETHPLTALQNRLEAGIRTISDQEARLEIKRLPGVETPLERIESRYPRTIEGQKAARKARDEAKSVFLKDKTVENETTLRQAEADFITAMRDVFTKKIEVGQAGFYELKLPNGRIAPIELVEQVEKWIDLPEIRTGVGAISNATLEVTRLVRSTLTNLDLAAGFIQGQVLFYRNNPAWWIAQSKTLSALVDDPTAYVKKNFAVMDEGMRVGAISIPTEFMFSRGGIANLPTRIPGIGVVFKAFNRAFEWFILTGQTELYKSVRTGALRRATGEITPAGVQLEKEAMDALVNLGSAIRKELGTESFTILGVRPNQRTAEQLAFFAARFFRANVGIIAQSFTGGEGGRESRKAMGSLIVGGLALLTAITWLQDRKLPNVTDPFAPDWMQFRVRKTFFSVLGPFHPYFRTIARMSVYTAQGKPDKAARELKNFLLSKAGIPFRVIDLAGQFIFKGQARTFEGEVIPFTPVGVAKAILGELVTPISIQEGMEAIPQGRPEALVGEIFGLVGRGSPYNQMDILFKQNTEINPEGISYRYAENWQEAEMERLHPEIANMMVGRGRGKWADASQMWAEIDDKYFTQEEALADGFVSGSIQSSAFRKRYTEIQQARRNEKLGVNRTLDIFQDERDLPDDPNDRALAEFFIILNQATSKAGIIDQQIVDVLRVRQEKFWTQEQKEFVERNVDTRVHPPIIQEYRDALEILSPYFDLPSSPRSIRQDYLNQNPEAEQALIRWFDRKPRTPQTTRERMGR